jgi:hypothetical protein
VCDEADAPLPFVDRAFSAVFCSNAFEHFANKALWLRELTRLTVAEGAIPLVGLQTAPTKPPNGIGRLLPPEGLRRLVADVPHRLVADRDVLARRLQRRGPPLARSAEIGALAPGASLSVVISRQRETFQDYGPFAHWPHAAGRLGLNPLYVVAGDDRGGRVHLHRTFPSRFYGAECGASEAYFPAAVTVGADVLADLAQGRCTPAVDRLIAQRVVMGMPERYGEPWIMPPGHTLWRAMHRRATPVPVGDE